MSNDELNDDELDALLTWVWPEIRDRVWLSLPAHMRSATARSAGHLPQRGPLAQPRPW
jgi:hypothetical protein